MCFCILTARDFLFSWGETLPNLPWIDTASRGYIHSKVLRLPPPFPCIATAPSLAWPIYTLLPSKKDRAESRGIDSSL